MTNSVVEATAESVRHLLAIQMTRFKIPGFGK